MLIELYHEGQHKHASGGTLDHWQAPLLAIEQHCHTLEATERLAGVECKIVISSIW